MSEKNLRCECIDDVCYIAVFIMQFEFINTRKLRWFLWFDQSNVRSGIQFLKGRMGNKPLFFNGSERQG